MPHARGHREVRHCICGGSMDARSSPATFAVDIARIFEEYHSGEEHAPCDARTAATARRRQEAAAIARHLT